MKNDEIVVLFSGGTDSTLTAALMAKEYRKVHLVTYDRFGFFSINNSGLNVEKLKNKFGKDKFTHQIIDINSLTKYVFYERYFRNLIKYRFFLLSNCGLCKLAMHIRTIIFCLKNGVANACDGANKAMDIFPVQMKIVIDEIKNMYSRFGVNFSTPVFNYEKHHGLEFTDRLNLEKTLSDEKKEDDPDAEKQKNTAGYKLFEMGLMPAENVKGTKLDKKMQARCFQLILFNFFVRWYYMYHRSYQQYKQATFEFFKDKINFFTQLLEDYQKKKEKSKLYKLIKPKIG